MGRGKARGRSVFEVVPASLSRLLLLLEHSQGPSLDVFPVPARLFQLLPKVRAPGGVAEIPDEFLAVHLFELLHFFSEGSSHGLGPFLDVVFEGLVASVCELELG